MRIASRFLVPLLALFCSTGVAQAQDLANTAAGTALSGAVRSAAVGPTALAYNPAAMHQVLQYAVDTGYYYNAPSSAHGFTAAIVDSKTNQMLAAGFSYTYLMDQSLGANQKLMDRSGHIVRGALASGYRSQGLNIHVGSSITYFDSDLSGGDRTKSVTVDAGILAVINDMFRLAVVGHNLVESKSDDLPRRLGIGTSIFFSSFLLSFDAVLDFETLDHTAALYKVGTEYSIAERFPIRVGYEYNDLIQEQYISGGVGFVTQVIGFEFGFRQNLTDKKDNLFSFNLRAYLP